MNLKEISQNYNTDKRTTHNYIPHYEFHFSAFRDKHMNVLEIGVGGYSNTSEGGESLKMWKEYFKNSHIYSFDIINKTNLSDERITILQGDQGDSNFLNYLTNQAEFDIIIDDGSHLSQHVIYTFNYLFPKMKEGGLYVIEDTQTSYWKSMGGELGNPGNLSTTMNYFKHLCDGLNHREYVLPGYNPSYFDQNITSIHFYHNLIFIYKGDNTQESNIIQNNVGNSWAF